MSTPGPDGNRSKLINAFKPGIELADPDRFAGRASQIRMLADSLRQDGSVPLIYGERGLGKSSLAVQVQSIAQGSADLLELLGAPELALAEEDWLIPFFVTCKSGASNTNDLIQKMINAATSLNLGISPEAELVDTSTKRGFNLKVFSAERTSNYRVGIEQVSFAQLDLEEKLAILCELLTTTFGKRVLFIVDELDKLGDSTGLATFLKNASSDRVKFLLVGIGSNVSDLLADHQSLERQLETVNLPTMTSKELSEIVYKAQAYLAEHGFDIRFEREATARLAYVAGGFPWFVHVLGRTALVDVFAEGRDRISEEDIRAIESSIVESQFAQQFADLYQMAVRNSPTRESALRAFAEWDDVDIPTREVYLMLSEQLGIGSGSRQRADLHKVQFGEVLVTPPHQRGIVRFRNQMFKAYVRLCPSIHDDIDARVLEAIRTRSEA